MVCEARELLWIDRDRQQHAAALVFALLHPAMRVGPSESRAV
jgi:hypothetical protein